MGSETEDTVHYMPTLNDSLPLKEVGESNNSLLHNITTNGSISDSSYGERSSQFSLPETITLAVILSLIIIFAVLGNLLVVVAILKDRNLRKPSNYFIISLSVADMLVALLVMTFAVVNDILDYWIFAHEFCSVWISFDIMLTTASILNLCAISFDRYIHIRAPLHYEQSMTPLRTCLIICLVWGLSGAISFIPIHLDWHRLGMQVEESPAPSPLAGEPYICLLELNPIYAVISSLISFYLPCLVMILIYVRLYLYARKQVKSINRNCRLPSTNNHHVKDTNKVSDHKAAITVGVIMGLFLFCWVPFFTINIVGSFCPSCIPNVVFKIFTWLGYFNSTLNPVIYSIFNKEFRNAFKKVLNCGDCPRFKKLELGRPIKFTPIPQQQKTAYDKPPFTNHDSDQTTSVV